MPNRPEDFSTFDPLDLGFINQKVKKMEGFLGNLKDFLNVDPSKIIYSPETLIEIVERVEKRRVYFHIFHKLNMGELNEGALFCFWIAKLCPFYYAGMPTNILNVKIAICLFVNAVIYHAQNTGKKTNITGHFISTFYYSLLYRDITKEALMLLAEEAMVD